MRGTVLRLRSDMIDCNPADDGSGEEHHNGDSFCEKQTNLSDCLNPVSTEDRTNDEDKNTLMTSLNLHSASIGKIETYSANNLTSPFQRPVFEWNDASMWKAMSRHPLFSKYMELQSQLNSLFEEIRMDCKRAACEKAFASLVKETTDSPIVATSVVQSQPPVGNPPKRKGRPPLKKKPGRPRKYVSTAASPEWSPASLIKHPRKCRDELFLSRKPSWICQNCARTFSSSGWLERHQSFCSFSKLPQIDSQDLNEDLSHASNGVNKLSTDDTSLSEETVKRTSAAPGSSEANSALSPTRSSCSIPTGKPEGVLLPPQTSHTSLDHLLKPKMENHNCTEDDEGTKKQCSFGINEGSVLSCGGRKHEFPSATHFQRHTDCSGKESDDHSSDSRVSSCKHCGKSFRKHRLLKRHQSICHIKSKKKLSQCTQCFKAFRTHSHFERHQKECVPKTKHIGREIQRCENCSLLFPTQKKLLKHQAICCPDSNNHMIKLLKCLKCSMMFPSYKRQLKHRAVCCPDSDTDAMVCLHCSKVFLMSDRMSAHRRKCKGVSKKLK